jgi:hypothetical protein
LTPIGEFVDQHDGRITDPDAGMDEFALWVRQVCHFHCIECLFVELNGIGGANQVWCHRVHAIWNGLYLRLGHRVLLLVSVREPGFRTISTGWKPWLYYQVERGAAKSTRQTIFLGSAATCSKYLGSLIVDRTSSAAARSAKGC